MIPMFYINPDMLADGFSDAAALIEKDEPAKPAPQLVAEVWQSKPVDPGRAWDAVMALCRGVA